MNIYQDKIPDNIFRLSESSWGEQLMTYLNKNSTVKPVNVFDDLRARKDSVDLYYMLDNHWNHTGAFYATNVLLNRISKKFPDVHAENLADYELELRPTLDGNLVSMLSNEGTYSDTIHFYSKKPDFKAHKIKPVGYPVEEGFPYPDEYEQGKEITDSKLPKILLVSDSFGMYVFPFVAEQFSHTKIIFDSWKYKLNENIVNHEKPDVFVFVVIESNLRNLLNNQSRLKK